MKHARSNAETCDRVCLERELPQRLRPSGEEAEIRAEQAAEPLYKRDQSSYAAFLPGQLVLPQLWRLPLGMCQQHYASGPVNTPQDINLQSGKSEVSGRQQRSGHQTREKTRVRSGPS